MNTHCKSDSYTAWEILLYVDIISTFLGLISIYKAIYCAISGNF